MEMVHLESLSCSGIYDPLSEWVEGHTDCGWEGLLGLLQRKFELEIWHWKEVKHF